MAKKKKLTLPEKIAEIRNKIEDNNSAIDTELEEVEQEIASMLEELEREEPEE